MGGVRQRSATCVHLFSLYKFALTLNSTTRSANGKFNRSHSWGSLPRALPQNLLLQWSDPTIRGFLFYDYFSFPIPTKVIFIPLVELHSTSTDSHMGQWAGKISTEVRLLLRCHCYKNFCTNGDKVAWQHPHTSWWKNYLIAKQVPIGQLPGNGVPGKLNFWGRQALCRDMRRSYCGFCLGTERGNQLQFW